MRAHNQFLPCMRWECGRVPACVSSLKQAREEGCRILCRGDAYNGEEGRESVGDESQLSISKRSQHSNMVKVRRSKL